VQKEEISDHESDEDIESIYNEEGMEDLEENDEITPTEEAFMHGYTQTKKKRLHPSKYKHRHQKRSGSKRQ